MIKEKHSITIDNGTEDGLDLEEISYPYYDDNLNLVGCTLNGEIEMGSLRLLTFMRMKV